jgi:hypothetical protein
MLALSEPQLLVLSAPTCSPSSLPQSRINNTNKNAEVISLLRELAAGLEEEAEEGGSETDEGSEEGEEGAAAAREELGPTVGGAAGVQWRQAYLGSGTQPPLTLGPLCVKQAAGEGDTAEVADFRGSGKRFQRVESLCVKQAGGEGERAEVRDLGGSGKSVQRGQSQQGSVREQHTTHARVCVG